MLREFVKSPEPGRHSGELYVRFLDFLHQTLRPRSYLEIGTQTGVSLAVVRCPAIAIDPELQVDRTALGARSMIVLHDCLPLDARMAERVFSGQPGSMWAGDVWKLIPILKEHRPDLRIHFVDAPPTGLAPVTHLDPGSTALADRYYEVLDPVAGLMLDEYGLRRLYESYPMLSSRKLIESPHALTSFFSLR